MRKIQYIYLLLLFACILIGSCIAFYLNTYNQITNNFKTSENKYDLLESANVLVSNLREAESNQRGFLITNDESYLSLYNESIFRLKSDKIRFYKIASVYGLTQSNPDDIKQLNLLINQKLKEMNITIALLKQGKNAEAVALIKSDIGMAMMKKITSIFQKLNAEQKYKETEAKQSIYTRRSSNRPIYLAIFTSIFLILLIIALLLTQIKIVKE